jgi:membrane protein required for colicin V production
MTTVDSLFLVIISLSIFVGILRGLIREVISISSLIISIWASINFGASVGTYFEFWITEPEFQLWIGMITTFFCIIILGMIFSRILSKIFRLTLSSKIDRILGACFGFFRGCLLTSIFVLGGQLTSAIESEWWNRSNLVPYSKLLADKMIEYIPTEINFTIKENGKT